MIYIIENPLKVFETEIKKNLQMVLDEMKIDCDISLGLPPENKGDYSFSVHRIAHKINRNPVEIADEIKKRLDKYSTEMINKIVCEKGYVNFYISVEKLKQYTLSAILETKNKYGYSRKKNMKIILEHTSANPTGPLHIGRARNPIIGDTLRRILIANGYDVETEYYVNDMGKQIAILVWAVDHFSVTKKDCHTYVNLYQKASKIFDTDERIKNEISEILFRYEHGDKKIKNKVHEICKTVIEHNDKILRKLNVEIDRYIWESTFVESGAVNEIIDKLKQSKYTKKENNAYYLDLSSYNISGRDNRFFYTRGDGTSLYTTRDITYHIYKLMNSDITINVLGEDHKLETKQLMIALSLLGMKKKPEIVFYSFVSLPDRRLSTRKGDVVYLEDMIEEAVNRAYQEVKKRRELSELHVFTTVSEDKMKTIAEQIGVGAVRYNIIKVQNEKKIIFSWDEAISFDGQTAPFIQYVHARCCSILTKSEGYREYDPRYLKLKQEIDLVKYLARYPSIVEKSGNLRKPHHLANYVYEIAVTFNQFYRDVPVLKADEKTRNARLALVDATRQVIKNGLYLLGIDAPEEM